ncbi:MAG: protein kinase [Planctomycetota bacterium]
MSEDATRPEDDSAPPDAAPPAPSDDATLLVPSTEASACDEEAPTVPPTGFEASDEEAPTVPPAGHEATAAGPPSAYAPALATPVDPAYAATLLDPEYAATLLDAAGLNAADPEVAQTLQLWSPTLAANPQAHDAGLTLRAPLPQRATGGTTTVDDRPGLDATTRVGTAAQAPPGGQWDYLIEDELGAGGMGTVYAARHATLDRRIALKMIREDLEQRPQVAERFLEEALVTGRLEHPNIVPVYDLGRTRERRLYLGMRLVRGEALDAILRREPATTPERLRRYLGVLSKVCDAVAYAHAQGVLHRDLKPSNVMVGEFGEVQVMDWGLALRLPTTPEEAGGAAGTPAYMSPEQANGDTARLGPQSDVYLLGAMLYEVLTGSPPHKAASALAALMSACAGRVEPPSERAPERELPSDLEQLCLRALAAEPEERVPTAQALKEGIELHLSHAEALRLIDQARELVIEQSAEGTHAERAARLARAQLLLQQAREVWPDSTEALELGHEARFRRVDLALDQGDVREARALIDTLEPTARIGEAQLEQLRLGVRRLRTRRRNQVLAAVGALFLSAGLTAAWSSLDQGEVAAGARQGARRELPRATWAAWEGLRQQVSHADLEAALAKVDQAASAAGWSDGYDRAPLAVAAGWEALRRGDGGLAYERCGRALSKPQRALLLSMRAQAERGVRPEVPALAWRAGTAQVDTAARVLGETLLLLSAARALGPGELAAHAAPLRARLLALGAVGPLLDARSGAPPELLAGPGAPALRLSWLDERERQGERRHERRVLVARDATGQELWRFPPPGIDERPLAPLLVREGERELLAVPLSSEVLALEPRSGVVARRLRLHDQVAALLPSGRPDELLVVEATGSDGPSRGQSAVLRATLGGWIDAPAPAGGQFVARMFGLRELQRQLEGALVPKQQGGPPRQEGKLDPGRARAELAALARLRARDPTSPFLPFEEGRRRLLVGEREAGLALLEQPLRPDHDLTPLELCFLAEKLDDEHGEHALAERYVRRAIEVSAARGLNPAINPLLIGNPALFVRKLARRARDAGEDERLLRLMHLSRELACVLEADRAYLPAEEAWYRAHGRADELTALAPYARLAQRTGGMFFAPQALVEGFDPILLAAGLTPVLLLLAALVITLRTRPARVADLRELGFRSSWARWLAFATNPTTRLTHTFMAYATRVERALFALGAAAVILGFLYITILMSTISRAAAVPITFGSGQLAHPCARGYIEAQRAALRPGDSEAPHLRLLIESDLTAGRRASAEALLERLRQQLPADPFALANLGYLRETAPGASEADRAAALELQRRAGQAAGPDGAVGRWNASRLAGTRPLPPLPVEYRALGRIVGEGPLRQLAGPADLHAVLRISASPLDLFLDQLHEMWRDGGRLAHTLLLGQLSSVSAFADDVDMIGAQALTLANTGFLIPLLLLFPFALAHLPFPARRSSGPGERSGRWLERAGRALNLAWPGALPLARGHVLLGLLALAAIPGLALLQHMGSKGAILLAIAMPNLPHPFATPDVRDVIVSDALRTLGPVAGVLLLGAYLAAWGHGAWSLWAWWRARPATAPARDP